MESSMSVKDTGTGLVTEVRLICTKGEVMGSHLGTISNLERVFKGPMGRCKITTHSSLSLTSNRVTINY